jgi:DMSO/TMAO reductase YedYZ molybdopterin-dependent catalytic subunit
VAVKGDVATPLSLTADDLAKLPRETATVPAPDGAKIVYEGVTLFEVLQKAGAPLGKQLRGKAMATYVLARASDGYQVAFTLGEVDPQFGNATILVADKRDGKPLPDKQGPFRIVCPNDKEGARSIRMLESLEVVRLAK